jgi:tetratricopeptide (TPR) repeat protein
MSGRAALRAAALLTLGLCSGLKTTAAHASESLAKANADLQAGRADEATAELQQALIANANDAEANNLLCRVEITLREFDAAAGHCEKATKVSPQNARYHLWLGRALGERASKASFLSAFSLAKRTREEFETAVRLDGKDLEALADLGEFYCDAPGAVGGGMSKAEGIAQKIDAIDASRGHQFRGEMLDKQKDLAGAEKELKAAITAPGAHASFEWMVLASFYRRHERWADMESAIASGATAAAHEKRSAVALYNGASTLARANRGTQEAVKLFESYIASPNKTEEGPAFEALTRLAKLRKAQGDAEGAKRDQAAALALAHNYKPAQDLTK